MVTDAAEGLEDSSHVSRYIFMHLCIYARARQLSWPWLDTDKEHTAAVDPSDSKTVTWPAGVPSPAGGPWRELTSRRGGE